MYLREVHTVQDIATLQSWILDHPLGVITTSLSSPTHPLLQSTHVPWVYNSTGPHDLGTLRGHMARNNPHSKALLEAVERSPHGELDHEVMVLFTLPQERYITPNFYIETKPLSGRVVPTWNYAATQIYGLATIFTEEEFILRQVDDLTKMQEAKDTTRKAWNVSDAPAKYVKMLAKAIIGIEIKVTRLEGKMKMSQEMNSADRGGIIDGLRASGNENDLSVAELIRKHGS